MKFKAPAFRNPIYYFIAVVVLSFFVMISCKRDMHEMPSTKLNENEVPQQIKDLIKQQGHSIYMPVNKHVPAILMDKNGNVIERNNIARRLTPDDICADPASAEVDALLMGVNNQITDCSNIVHTLTVNWLITSSFDLATANPNSPYQASRGRIRIKNGSTTTYSDLNIGITSENIKYLRNDPDDPSLKVYQVTYVKTGIPHTYLSFGNFTAVEVSLSIYSDCGDPYDSYLMLTPYTAAFAGQVGLDPCLRNDEVYISPSTLSAPPPSSDQCGYIAGSYVTGSPGECQNYKKNLGSYIQVKRTGDPDNNYKDLRTIAAGEISYRTNGYVLSSEVRLMKGLKYYVPNIPTSYPASYTFRWKNFDGTDISSISCFTDHWSTPVSMFIYDF